MPTVPGYKEIKQRSWSPTIKTNSFMQYTYWEKSSLIAKCVALS